MKGSKVRRKSLKPRDAMRRLERGIHKRTALEVFEDFLIVIVDFQKKMKKLKPMK